LTVRKIAAASGLAKMVRKVCSRASPVRPTWIVAMTISQASRLSSSSATIRRAEMLGRRLPKKPRTMRTHSVRKNSSSAVAVATCSATMKAR